MSAECLLTVSVRETASFSGMSTKEFCRRKNAMNFSAGGLLRLDVFAACKMMSTTARNSTYLVTVPTHNVLNPLRVLHSIMINQYLLWGVRLLTPLTNQFLQVDKNLLIRIGGWGVFGDWGGQLLRSLLLRGWCIWTLTGLSFSLVLSAAFLLFRWFKFTLKPPYRIAIGNFFLAIWDTSHWNFLVKFGLKTAWDMSYDILLSLLKFVNFWWLQGRWSILAKIGCLQKIKVFLMKERQGFDATWGF